MLCVIAAPAAQAAFSVSGSATPANPTSGANSNLTVNIQFGGGTSQAESVENLTVELPPGLVGNPNAAPLCTVAELNADDCPGNTQLGDVSSNVSVGLLVPQTVQGSLYNLTPQPGEPARFGIVLRALPLGLGNLVLQSGAVLRKDDFGLNSVVNGIPNEQDGIPIHVNSQVLTLYGESKTGKAFLRNPTSCGTQTTGFVASSHGGEEAEGEATFELSGCEALPFKPKLTAVVGAPGRTTPSTLPPLTTVIEQKEGEAGLKRAQVVLPAGVGAVSTELGNECPIPAFEASTCPPASIVGSAESESPLLEQPLAGDVSIVAPDGPGLPQLGVDLKGPLAIQLLGNFILSPGPGNVFEGLPDIPISRFELKFVEDKLVLTSRELCEPPPALVGTDFLGYNGAKRTGNVAAQIAGCTPSAKVKLSRTASKHPRMKLKVKGGGSTLKKTTLKLPRQLKFSGKRAFKRGTKATGDSGKLRKSAVKGRKRKLKLKADKGSGNLKVKVAKRALKRVKPIKRGKKLRFPTKVTDAGGFETKLKLKAKGR